MRKFPALLLGLILTATASASDFSIRSSAYQENQRIPTIYTCEGSNISPPLTWANAPADTKSFVLTFSSPEWIDKEIYLWILYNIPSQVKHLEQDVYTLPSGTMALENFYDQKTYRGPCPPNPRLHQYIFTIYALDEVLSPQDEDMEPEKLLHLIKPHILKKASLTGIFSH